MDPNGATNNIAAGDRSRDQKTCLVITSNVCGCRVTRLGNAVHSGKFRGGAYDSIS